jgi:isopenicillin N synthase-like dioxygenase
MWFNYYPAYPRPDKVWGLLAHRDPSMVSILHQDSVSGLRVKRHGEWLDVAPVPFSFVVNVGDMLKVTT